MKRHLNIMAGVALCALIAGAIGFLLTPAARAAGGADYGRGAETDPVASALFATVTNDIATVAATKIVVTNAAATVAANKIVVTNAAAAFTSVVGTYTNAQATFTNVYNAAGALISHTP